MALKATFTSFHGEEYQEAYIRVVRLLELPCRKWAAQFDAYSSEDAYKAGEPALEGLSSEFEYDEASNIYSLAFAALKEQAAPTLAEVSDLL